MGIRASYKPDKSARFPISGPEIIPWHDNIVEVAKDAEENGKTLKFIPVLDIGVLWDPVGNWGYTRVYRKPTTLIRHATE